MRCSSIFIIHLATEGLLLELISGKDMTPLLFASSREDSARAQESATLSLFAGSEQNLRDLCTPSPSEGGNSLVKSIPEVPMRTKLQPGETVALTVRKHWIVLAKPALFFLVVLFSFPFRHVKLAGFEALLSYLFPYLLAMSAGLLLYRYFDRKVNIWTVTTLRLIDEWGIVTHRSKENPLDKINDIVVEQTIAGRIFNYGSISVQTAATAGETVIDFVERPKDLKQTINGQKALRSEREEKPGSMRNVHGRQSMTVAQTVLFHESLKPPFSLRCPYCDGEIVIDNTGN